MEQDSNAGLTGAAAAVVQSSWVPPELMAIGSMFSVQLGAALAVPVMSEIGSVATTALRLFWAGILLAVIVRPRFGSMTRQQWFGSVGLGVVIAGLTLCYFVAISRIPMGPATAIEFLGPLGVALAGSRRWLHLTLALVAAAGVLLLTREESHWSVDAWGLCFAAGAALGWAAYILLMKRVGASFPGLQGLSVALLVAAIAAMPVGFVAGGNMFKLTPVLWTIGLGLLTPLRGLWSSPDDAEYGWQDIEVFAVRHIERVFGQGIATPFRQLSQSPSPRRVPPTPRLSPFTFHLSPSFPCGLATLREIFRFRSGGD